MKALAEQIGDIDGVQIYRRFRRTRADGRSRRANSCDVARRTLEHRNGSEPLHRLRGGRLLGRTRAGDAVCCARWRAPRLPRDRVHRLGERTSGGRLARPRRQRTWRADRWARAVAARTGALFFPSLAATRACAAQGRRAARSRLRALNTFVTCCRGQRMASSRARASANPYCCRCSRAMWRPTPSSGWSANAGARCRSSCRTTSVRPVSRVRWWWCRRRTSPR